MSTPVPITVYGRENCHLCALAKTRVERASDAADVPVDITEIDVDSDPELAAEYGERVPVVFVDGWPAFSYHVDTDELQRQLEQHEF